MSSFHSPFFHIFPQAPLTRMSMRESNFSHIPIHHPHPNLPQGGPLYDPYKWSYFTPITRAFFFTPGSSPRGFMSAGPQRIGQGFVVIIGPLMWRQRIIHDLPELIAFPDVVDDLNMEKGPGVFLHGEKKQKKKKQQTVTWSNFFW